MSPSLDRVDAEVIRAKRVFMESKNTILAARDDLDRHQRWLERFTAQPVSPAVSNSIEQQTRCGRISSGEPFRVIPTTGRLVKGRVLLSALGVFGISLLAMAVMWGSKSHVYDLPPASVAPKMHDAPQQSAFVDQTVAKTSNAENPLPPKPKVKIKSKWKRSRDERQLPWWQTPPHITVP